MASYKMYHNGKKFVFEGEGVKVMDDNVHALMPKIKRLKLGSELLCTESKKLTGKTVTRKQRQS